LYNQRTLKNIKMTKRTKLTKVELSNLRKSMTDTQQAEGTVNQLCIMISDAEDALKSAVAKLKSTRAHHSELVQALDKRYGNVNVNITDGTLSEADDNTGDS